MAKLAQTQEPSMEEILASIRRIITEDEVGEAPASGQAGGARESRAAAASREAPVADDNPRADDEDEGEGPATESADVLELSEEQVTTAHQADDSTDRSGDEGFAAEEARAANGSTVKAAAAADADEPPHIGTSLLSAGADAAVTSAFSTLANTILSSQARTLEDLVREMLRPMLKSWLDDNLPPLVERLVRDEIERVSRGRQ